MACESWREKLDAYVDGELLSPDAAGLAKHLEQCAACSRAVLYLVQEKRAVRVAGQRYQASAQLREKVRQSLGKPGPRLENRIWKLVALPATLVLVLSLAAALYLQHQKNQRLQIYSELTDLHVATLASATPVDVVSSDRHTVKPWFAGKIPFTFNLPELQGTDFTLVGGRVSYLEQMPGAHLLYRVRQHQISVFIFQERGGQTAIRSPSPLSRLSFTMESWTKNGLRYFVVGDVGAQDVERLSKLLRDAG